MREAASPQPPPLSAADADLIAERTAARIVDAVTDEKTVERITAAWSGAIGRMIGRGIRRLAWTVLAAVLLYGAVKFELLGKLLGLRGMNFDAAFERLLGHEGGYVDNPRDPGGETKYGISRRSYPGEDIAGYSGGATYLQPRDPRIALEPA